MVPEILIPQLYNLHSRWSFTVKLKCLFEGQTATILDEENTAAYYYYY
jgi:hypothetical protein